MPAKVMKTWQKATALVPLALLSGAWTTSLTVDTSASATPEDPGRLPDGTAVPTEAIEAPASVSTPGQIAPGVPKGSAASVISSASTNGIPSAALEAYQRAAQVIDSAKPGCNLGWELVGAIGRVESDHGRYGGNTLGDDGKSRPGIYGIPLDGSNGTAEIKDTDAGQYDDDRVYDRAVGPMQFIPSTWSVVGVDGDGDGERDPQDIDDAALATAVYLCSGAEDLSTTAGLRSAVYRYNHSQEYVDLVLSIMQAYAEGDFSSVPNGTSSSTVFTPSSGDAVLSPATSGSRSPSFGNVSGGGNGGSGGGSFSTAGSAESSSGGSTAYTDSSPEAGSTAGGGEDPAPTPVPTEAPSEEPTQDPVEKTEKQVEDTTNEVKKKVKDTVDQAPKPKPPPPPPPPPATYSRAECLALSVTELNALGGLEGCIGSPQ